MKYVNFRTLTPFPRFPLTPFPIDAPPRSRVIRCILHDGDKSHAVHGALRSITERSHPTSKDALPVVLLHSAPF